MHPIATNCLQSLQDIENLLKQLSDEQYSIPQSILHQNSIGMHVRHVLEFYHCLMEGLGNGAVDYDARKRNIHWQTSRSEANSIIAAISLWLQSCETDCSINLKFHTTEELDIATTLFRELAYNHEHCIHHLAIIRICLQEKYPEISIPDTFGVANATIKYRNVLSKLSSWWRKRIHSHFEQGWINRPTGFHAWKVYVPWSGNYISKG